VNICHLIYIKIKQIGIMAILIYTSIIVVT